MSTTTSTEITLEELEKWHQELVRLANSPNEQVIPVSPAFYAFLRAHFD